MYETFSEYKSYVDTMNRSELLSIINTIDKTKYPDRYEYVLTKYESIKNIEPYYGSILEKNHASNMKRFVNLLIDSVVLFIVIFICSFILYFVRLSSIVQFLKGIPFAVFIGYFFYVILEYYTQQSIGKFITKTKVISENGEKPILRQILIRTLCRYIPFEALSFLDYPPIGMHDEYSKTRVVNTDIKSK
jgi:uncharacterized RDD family membrane protein YckC